MDPLGHVAGRRTHRDQQEATDPTRWITRYAPGASAVQRSGSVWPASPVLGFEGDSTEQARDRAGNLWRDREWGWGTMWNGTSGMNRLAEARHFYDAEERLRVVQRQDDTFDGGSTFRRSGVWEEYRYDPLGRRVMVRTRREDGLCTVSAATCINGITRFVWAGDQLLWELRAPGAEGGDLEATTGPGERYGRVSYTQGGGIDRPLALHKEGWESIIPHESWRGQFAAGTCVADGASPCGAVSWPGWQTNAYHAMTAPPESENWRGGLVDGMRDATGQMYMRNRYYDSGTGQFTQPDPIGIAGGLNVYGFADGDPVSYSDPYGLSAVKCPPDCRITEWGGGGPEQLKGFGHVKKRHMGGRWGDQFVNMTDEALRHVLSTTVETGEMVAEQIAADGTRRFVFERSWGQIGTRDQRIARVVIGESGDLITAFPVRNAMRAGGAGAAGNRLTARALRWGARAVAVATIVGAALEVALSPTPAGSKDCTGLCQE